MFLQPCAEERRHFVRKANGEVEAARCSRVDRGLDDTLELVVGDLRDDRGDRDVAGNACGVERLHRGEALPWPSSARLEDMSLEDVEAFLIKKAMARYGNVSQAARALGLSRSALYRRLERYKL